LLRYSSYTEGVYFDLPYMSVVCMCLVCTHVAP